MPPARSIVPGIPASVDPFIFESGRSHALTEPVATDLAYRKLDLGKAAVLESVRRAGKLGAIHACVGSSQEFYYRIGFRPHVEEFWWEWQA